MKYEDIKDYVVKQFEYGEFSLIEKYKEGTHIHKLMNDFDYDWEQMRAIVIGELGEDYRLNRVSKLPSFSSQGLAKIRACEELRNGFI